MDEHQNQNSIWQRSGLAWIAAVVVAICCILADLYVISSIRASYRLLDGLGVHLPPLTLILLATRPQYFALFFLGAAFLVIAKEMTLRDSRDRLFFTVTVFVAVLVVAGLVQFILHLPLFHMVKKLGETQ